MSFNVGDEVKVIAIGHGITSPKYIGRVFKVVRVDSIGWVNLNGEASGFSWAPDLLELTANDRPPYHAVIAVINKIKAKREALGYQW